MADVMMKIGDVKFGMGGPAYNKLTHVLSADWASQARINRRPALQFTGVGGEKIVLSGVIFPLFFKIGISSLEAVRALVLDARPEMLIEGTGKRYGYFVVKEVAEDRSHFIPNGAPQRQEFTITLERYGEDMLSNDAVVGGGSVDLDAARAAAASNVA